MIRPDRVECADLEKEARCKKAQLDLLIRNVEVVMKMPAECRSGLEIRRLSETTLALMEETRLIMLEIAGAVIESKRAVVNGDAVEHSAATSNKIVRLTETAISLREACDTLSIMLVELNGGLPETGSAQNRSELH